VTAAILEKRYTQATNIKQELEERQREKANARKEEGHEWRPRFFREPITKDGRPHLTPEGEQAIRGLQAEQVSNNLFLRSSIYYESIVTSSY